MSSVTAYLKGKPILILLALLLLLFTVLRLFPSLDQYAGGRYWFSIWLSQFYFGSLTSLLALITALFAGTTLGARTNTQALFVTFAFIAMSALLVVSNVTTPSIFVPRSENEVFIWSLRFSFPVGAVFFALASISWNEATEVKLVARRHLFGVLGSLIFLVYVVVAFSFPDAFDSLGNFTPVIEYVLAAVTFTFLFIAIRRVHIIAWHQGSRIENSLAITLVLLAAAQFVLAFGTPERLNWLLYYPLTLAALFVALRAMVATLETSRDLQLTHYFAALGIIAIVGVALVIGEVGKHWLDSEEVGRSSIVPLTLAQGALSFLVLFLIVSRLNRLITERTLALKQEQYLRSELMQLIVHDLKSPLSVIKGGLNLLAKGRLGTLTETQTRLLTNLEQSGDDILQMINDLLDVERMEEGALKLRLSTVAIDALLHECVNDLQIVASTYKQQLTVSHPAVLPSVQVDRNLLRRVLNNLLINALKFTPEQGEINVNACIGDNTLLINVADSGPGVPAADRERIFEKFAQVKGTERRGAGLGLTFCKMAIEAHGGTITVSDSANGGALFKIRLPLRGEPEPESATTEEYAPEIANLAGDLYRE